MLESYEKFTRAEAFLEAYSKESLTEIQARELIHQMGIKTFPRPEGIPDNFIIKVSKKGAGIKYIDPDNLHTSIRVMPGKSHSPFPYQREPYVIYKKRSKILDKFGNVVSAESPEAHIPINEFTYRGN